eukprot:NODE_2378_length_1435_cov_57.973323_g2261_i0.p1 GENE.NODE_2378_length_1435_cov_57.973323_g2261_i0~~NODE_2378_length_1435_cov_57.973323_g2261_i0.p1  ORF type:complete len:429 (-),score=106.30 NODE_2378_length_1435_cov_57.973323_g2261_i0:61-1347(-)
MAELLEQEQSALLAMLDDLAPHDKVREQVIKIMDLQKDATAEFEAKVAAAKQGTASLMELLRERDIQLGAMEVTNACNKAEALRAECPKLRPHHKCPKCDWLEGQKEYLKKRLLEAEEKCAEAKAVPPLMEDIVRLQQREAQLNKQMAATTKERDDFKDQLDGVRLQNKNMAASITDLKEQIKSLKRELSTANAKATAAASSAASAFVAAAATPLGEPASPTPRGAADPGSPNSNSARSGKGQFCFSTRTWWQSGDNTERPAPLKSPRRSGSPGSPTIQRPFDLSTRTYTAPPAAEYTGPTYTPASTSYRVVPFPPQPAAEPVGSPHSSHRHASPGAALSPNSRKITSPRVRHPSPRPTGSPRLTSTSPGKQRANRPTNGSSSHRSSTEAAGRQGDDSCDPTLSPPPYAATLTHSVNPRNVFVAADIL